MWLMSTECLISRRVRLESRTDVSRDQHFSDNVAPRRLNRELQRMLARTTLKLKDDLQWICKPSYITEQHRYECLTRLQHKSTKSSFIAWPMSMAVQYVQET